MEDSYLNSLLGENERILFNTHRHWTVLVGEILSETVLSVALIVLVTVLVLLPPPVGNPLWALGYALLLFPAISLLRDVTIWASRKFVITSRRVIHVEGVLNKQITDSSLEKVNDVKLEQSFWGRVFGYGNVEILTASELGASKFTRIANPIQFKTAMLNAKNRLEYDADGGAPRPTHPKLNRASLAERLNDQRGASAGAPDVPALLMQLDQLRQAGVLTEAEFQSKKTQLLERM
jgi:uncharacterized membrane protein YdbT with pleckstrin-like domain